MREYADKCASQNPHGQVSTYKRGKKWLFFKIDIYAYMRQHAHVKIWRMDKDIPIVEPCFLCRHLLLLIFLFCVNYDIVQDPFVFPHFHISSAASCRSTITLFCLRRLKIQLLPQWIEIVYLWKCLKTWSIGPLNSSYAYVITGKFF